MTATLLDLPSRAFSFEQRETYLFTVVLSLVAVWFFLPGPALGADAAPAGSSGVTAPSPADAAPSGDSTSQPQRFYIRKFRVDGTRGINGAPPILSRAEVEAVIYPFMGPYRTNQDVEDARAALERAYQAKGYQTVSVQTPDQSMTDVLKKGVIVLKVTQMPVGRLRVVGSRYYLPSDIKAQAPSLAEGSVPNFNEVTKDIVSLNQLPDRIGPVFSRADLGQRRRGDFNCFGPDRAGTRGRQSFRANFLSRRAQVADEEVVRGAGTGQCHPSSEQAAVRRLKFRRESGTNGRQRGVFVGIFSQNNGNAGPAHGVESNVLWGVDDFAVCHGHKSRALGARLVDVPALQIAREHNPRVFM